MIQFPVVEKFGYEASRKGVSASMRAFGPLNAHPVIAEKNALMQYLIDPAMQQQITDKDLAAPRGVPYSRRRSPDPEEWPEEGGKVWQVIGGEKTGGIMVRKGEDTKSAEFAERLEKGA